MAAEPAQSSDRCRRCTRQSSCIAQTEPGTRAVPIRHAQEHCRLESTSCPYEAALFMALPHKRQNPHRPYGRHDAPDRWLRARGSPSGHIGPSARTAPWRMSRAIELHHVRKSTGSVEGEIAQRRFAAVAGRLAISLRSRARLIWSRHFPSRSPLGVSRYMGTRRKRRSLSR